MKNMLHTHTQKKTHPNAASRKYTVKKKRGEGGERIGYQGGDDEALLVGNALAMPKNPVLVLEGRLGRHWWGFGLIWRRWPSSSGAGEVVYFQFQFQLHFCWTEKINLCCADRILLKQLPTSGRQRSSSGRLVGPECPNPYIHFPIFISFTILFISNLILLNPNPIHSFYFSYCLYPIWIYQTLIPPRQSVNKNKEGI